eukprot:607536-Amphidinium_carterae.1
MCASEHQISLDTIIIILEKVVEDAPAGLLHGHTICLRKPRKALGPIDVTVFASTQMCSNTKLVFLSCLNLPPVAGVSQCTIEEPTLRCGSYSTCHEYQFWDLRASFRPLSSLPSCASGSGIVWFSASNS